MKRTAAALLAVTASLAVHAGRPLTTEDASTLPDKACQLEAWVDRSREATQSWMVPACNFGGGIEWQVGLARTSAGGRTFFSESFVQAKTVLRPMEPTLWGYGFIVGSNRFPARQARRGYENPYVTVPITAMAGETTLVHLNVGWIRDGLARRDTTFWGVGVESPVSPRITAVAEVLGENAERPFLRAGGRAVVIRDRLEVDLTMVTRPGGTRAERYISLGFHWQAASFLP